MKVKSSPMSDNDMEVMLTIHDAFRRDAVRLSRAAERGRTDDPAAHDALLVGWHGFSTELHHHHCIEDDHLWPMMRSKLADRSDDLAVLDAMEAEHSLIDPALAAVEEAFDDRDSGMDRLADRVDELVGLLHAHLAHEETETLPLVREVVSQKEWGGITKAVLPTMTYQQIAHMGPYYMEGASPQRVQIMMQELPLPLRLVHRFWWEPKYRRTRRWG